MATGDGFPGTGSAVNNVTATSAATTAANSPVSRPGTPKFDIAEDMPRYFI